MTKELAETLKPLLKTRAAFAVFSLEDGSAWFCASCGATKERTPIQGPMMMDMTQMPHGPDCQERAHARAIAALAAECAEAGV